MKGPQHGVTTLSAILLIAANLLIPIAIYVFGSGFFPYKPLLPGLAVYGNSEYGPPPAAPFDRVIFMVVDALRRYETARARDRTWATANKYTTATLSTLLIRDSLTLSRE